jgi:hypothetical protein
MYTTKANIEAYLRITLDPSLNAQVDKWINSATEYIRNYTNREWVAGASSTRLYDGTGTQKMMIDEFIDVTDVKVGEDWNTNMATIDYTTEPYNRVNKNTVIYKTDHFPCGQQNVAVTAKFGFSATVPADIEFATTVLASAIVLAGTNEAGEVASEQIGNYRVTYKDDKHKDDMTQAMAILETRKFILI